MLLLDGWHLWGWFILFLWLFFSIMIFSHFAHTQIEHLLKIALRKDITIPRLTPESTLSVMPWFVVYWALWSLGFSLLVASLMDIDIFWSVGFGFPLAATLGIITFISPGGLGTREAIMVGYLTLAQCQQMRDDGHLIAMYLASWTARETIDEKAAWVESRAVWFQDNGFEEGAYHAAVGGPGPVEGYGHWSADVEAALMPEHLRTISWNRSAPKTFLIPTSLARFADWAVARFI